MTTSRPRIDQTVVFTYTDDLESASRFFSETLELDFVVDQGSCHIYRLTPESFIGVCQLADRPTEQTGVTVTLVTSDVEGWHDFLVGKGVEFVRPPAQSDQFGVFSSLFMSPHGYRVEVQRFNDDLWHTRQLNA